VGLRLALHLAVAQLASLSNRRCLEMNADDNCRSKHGCNSVHVFAPGMLLSRHLPSIDGRSWRAIAPFADQASRPRAIPQRSWLGRMRFAAVALGGTAESIGEGQHSARSALAHRADGNQCPVSLQRSANLAHRCVREGSQCPGIRLLP
jgi:hypothetical protein